MHSPSRTAGFLTVLSSARIALLLGLLLPAISAAQNPAAGMFLVATEDVRGSMFRETVVLLLHYEDGGAIGLVINRPMQADATTLLSEIDGIESYEGTLYWGGPVQITSVRALLRSTEPPADAVRVVDEVYLVSPDGPMPPASRDPSGRRYFLGYAGWGPGQLDGELLDGSWHLVPANAELVFEHDSADIWRRLRPAEAIRAALPGAIASHGRTGD